ncbi:MAG: hypothetical protein RI905_980, partial [Pseudomonadota bacterium]
FSPKKNGHIAHIPKQKEHARPTLNATLAGTTKHLNYIGTH